MTFPVPYGKSQMGIRPNWPNGDWALSHAHAASLDLGLNDCILIADITRHRPAILWSVLIEKWAGAPLLGYDMRFLPDSMSVGLCDGVGGVSWHASNPAVLQPDRNILVIFVDRDGNIYFFANGADAGTMAVDPATNIDQSNAGSFLSSLNSSTAINDGVSGLQFYVLDPAAFPDATGRAQIVAEAQANPYGIPPTLSSRPAFATEFRLGLDFADIDPNSTVVPDISAYGNDMTLAAAAAWKSAGKEMKASTRTLTPDGGPTYGLRNSYVEQLNLTGISVGTDDFILHFLLKDYEQEAAYVRKIGALQYLFTLGDNTYADNIQIYNQYAASDVYFGITGAGNLAVANNNRIIEGIYKNTIDVMVLVRALSYKCLINGHDTFGAAKAAHNANTQRLRMMSNNIVGGVSTPGIGCLFKIYIGDLSGFSDADLLGIHQKYLSYPYETPAELAAYEKFRFTGRKPDGSQIPPGSAVVYNEKNGETLAIQGGLTWGDARSAVHV